MKVLLSTLILAVVLVGGFVLLNSHIYNEKQANAPNEETAATPTFSWAFEPSARYEETMPWHNLSLVVNSEPYSVGEYQGCTGEGSTGEGIVTKTTCWFAGGGNEVAVFLEGDRYLIKERWIQEAGAQGEWDTEGDWETKFAL